MLRQLRVCVAPKPVGAPACPGDISATLRLWQFLLRCIPYPEASRLWLEINWVSVFEMREWWKEPVAMQLPFEPIFLRCLRYSQMVDL